MIRINTGHTNLKTIQKKINLNTPLFAQYTPDFKAIETLATKYKRCTTIIVIGNGGSITSFLYFVTALGTKKKIQMLKKEGVEIVNGKIDLKKYLYKFR